MENMNNQMRLPEEGAPTGAGPGTGVIVSGQRPRDSRRLGRGNPEFQSITQRSRITPRSPPVESAAPNLEELTQMGLPRRRIKWTYEMNWSVMKAFFKATRTGADTLNYRQQMRNIFLLDYPNLDHLSEQNISDRRRTIERRNMLPQSIIDQIRREAQDEPTNPMMQRSGLENPINEFPPNTMQPNNISPILSNTIETQITEDQNSPNNNQNRVLPINDVVETILDNTEIQDSFEALILEIIMENFIKWKGIDPNNRPPLPKVYINRNMKRTIHCTNQVIENHFTQIESLMEINVLIYAAATTVLFLHKKLPYQYDRIAGPRRKPRWESRLENTVLKLREIIGRLTQYNNGNRTKNIIKAVTPILRKHSEHPVELLDTLKQKLSVYSTRLRRYRQTKERRTQNSLFVRNQKRFYKTMETKENISNIPPKVAEIENFWKSVWSQSKTHNVEASWIEEERDRNENIQEQRNTTVTESEIKEIIQKTHNWKSPGPDRIHNFWYKQFEALHGTIAKQITEILRQPDLTPNFLTKGKTYIIPKTSDTGNPSKYRPITCLSTMYKIITACITNKINIHLHNNNILTEEQKGCRKNSQGCKEQIIIDSTILGQVNGKQRNLVTCYIDYKKAFDSIPHTWLIKVLEIYKIDGNIIKFLSTVMKSWRTTIDLRLSGTHITTNEIQIKCGIFQGDSLSALWFCLCLNPLSVLLNKTGKGFNIRHQGRTLYRITHLLYMDDIKLYAGSNPGMTTLLRITEKFTEDTRMQFGMDKCKMLHIARGRTVTPTNFETVSSQEIENMQHEEVYKYLGIYQNRRIDHARLKRDIRGKYIRRLKCILKSKLNSKNLFMAINAYAIPVLTFTFGILKWSITDLEELNRLNRTQLTKFRYHHPNASIERVNLKRCEGGRGLIDLVQMHKNQVLNLTQYFRGKNTPLHNAIVATDEKYTPLDLKSTTSQTLHPSNYTSTLKEKWMQKPLHGQHYTLIADPRTDKDLSYAWLRSGYLFPETEGFIQAIQDQVIPTKNYRKYILKENVDNDKCRRCMQVSETIQHITGGCTTLAAIDYTERHNLAAKILHQQIAKNCRLSESDLPYYKYTPQNVLENIHFKLYWDRTIITDRTIQCNRPDITLLDKQNSITYLIDIAIPVDSNIHQKEQEKISKYTPLAIEIKELWNQQNVFIIPIVMSATGITTEKFLEYLGKLKINKMIHAQLQKAVLVKTAHIVRKFLNNF